MPKFRAGIICAVLLTLAAPIVKAQEPPDLERGKKIFRSVGECMTCHGWPADGKTGVHLRAPTGSNLRESALDKDGLFEVIRCGILGTPMPYHGRGAYRDQSCYGMALSDFEDGGKPVRGKTFNDDDIENVVAYLQAHVIGKGSPTLEECVEFFEDPAAKACSVLE